MFTVLFIIVRVCSLFEFEWISVGVFYIVYAYIYFRWRSNYEEMIVLIPLTCLICQFVVPAPSHDPDFQHHIYIGSRVYSYTSFWVVDYFECEHRFEFINIENIRYSIHVFSWRMCGTGNLDYFACISMNAQQQFIFNIY